MQISRKFSAYMLFLTVFIGGLLLTEASVPKRDGTVSAQGRSSLRFFGSGSSDLDRVKIPLGPINNGQITSSYPVNIGNDFTIELWMRADATANSAEACGSGNLGWYYGNVVIDRDVFGDDVGDYGIAIRGGRIIFGVNNGEDEAHLCGNTPVTNGEWRHVAVTRSASSGLMRIFIDGQLDAEISGPTGSISYPVRRVTNWPNSDPYLVLAAEKHDFPGSLYYNGLIDDLRISSSVRYNAAFTRPNAPHPADANTVALYRFDKGAGTTIIDNSGAAGGSSDGQLIPRSSANSAEHWSSDTPFTDVPTITNTPTNTPTSTPTTTPTSTPTTTPTNTPVTKQTCTSTAVVTYAPTSTSTPIAAPEPEQTPSSTIGAAPPITDLAYQVYLPMVICS